MKQLLKAGCSYLLEEMAVKLRIRYTKEVTIPKVGGSTSDKGTAWVIPHYYAQKCSCWREM